MLTASTGNITAIWGSGARDVYFADRSTSLQHWTGSSFSLFTPPTAMPIWSVWGSSATNFWMVGLGNEAVQSKNGAIIVASAGNTNLLSYVWGSADNDIWAVGSSTQAGMSAIVHYNGTAWVTVTSTVPELLVAGAVVAGDVWAVGTNGAVFHYNGTGFDQLVAANRSDLYGAWGVGPSDMWAVGNAGTIVRHEP